jgi:hypothetical protein
MAANDSRQRQCRMPASPWARYDGADKEYLKHPGGHPEVAAQCADGRLLIHQPDVVRPPPAAAPPQGASLAGRRSISVRRGGGGRSRRFARQAEGPFYLSGSVYYCKQLRSNISP